MNRWRVKASRTTPTWYHACEVSFVDAADAHEAKALIEGRSEPGNQFRAWAITPATPEMEAAHQAWLDRCARWIVAARTASAHRGIIP
jgi:hypothetical protein